MRFFPTLLRGNIAFLLVLTRGILAEYLDSPEFIDQLNTGEPMLQGNGISGSADGRIFASTQPGNLWMFSPLVVDAEPVVFTPQTWVGVGGEALLTRSTSSPIVKEDANGQILYVVHVVVDVNPDTSQPVQSRVFGVDPDTGAVLWSSVFENSVAVGTPAIGQDFIYVSLNSVSANQGRLSLIQVSSFNEVFIVANYDSQFGPWGPPSVVEFPPQSTWTEAVVWGDSLANGNSPQGRTYILKVGSGGPSPVDEVVTDATGSTVTAPALGAMQQNGNDIDWNVATGNFEGRVNVWREADWSTMLGEEQVPPGEEVTPSWTRVGSQFSPGQQAMQVSPVFSSAETTVFVAGDGGGLAGWEVRRGRRQWDRPTSEILSQPVIHVPDNLENENAGVLYACDTSGVLRQLTADEVGTLTWAIDYCEANSLGGSCPQVSANIFLSTNGNRVYVPNEEGSIFVARVAVFETPAPTSTPTLPPVDAPVAIPTTPTRMPTSEEEFTSSPSFSPDESGSESNESKASGLSENGLYILLAVVVVALCVCLCAASFILKNRRKNKESEEKIKEEMAAVNRWKSNKKMYEQEIKELEHDTMQELSNGSPKQPGIQSQAANTPETIAAESESGSPEAETQPDGQVMGWKPGSPGSRSRSRSSSRARTGTLGSISESMDEERASPIPRDLDNSNSEVARNLAIQFASEDNEVAVAKEVHNGKATSEVKPSQQENSTTKANDSQTGPVSQDNDVTPSDTKDIVDATSNPTTVVSTEGSAQGKSESESGDKKAPTTQKQMLGLLNLEWWNDNDDNRSDFNNSQLSGTTDEPGRISTRFEPQVVGTGYSTDDDGTAVSSMVSGLSARSQHTQEPGAINRRTQSMPNSSFASDVMSVDSGSIYLDDNTAASPPQSPPEILKPQATPPTPQRVQLEPPDGASVIASEPVLTGYSEPSVSATINPATKPTAKPSSYIPNKYSAAVTNSRRIRSTAQPLVESHHGERLTAFEGKSMSRGRPRAGLFSRREIQDNTSAASSQSVSNQSYSEWSESDSSNNAVMSQRRGELPDTKYKAPKKNKASKRSKQSGTDDTPWNSFLNQLAMAEQEFFNPKLKASSAPKTRAVSPPPPPPPPESGSSDESEGPPPPPPSGRVKIDNTKRQYGRTRARQSFPKPLPPSDKYSR